VARRRDLSNTSVFFDFDGTITTADVGLHLLERLADERWVELDDQYVAGTLGSRDCIEQQWQCIPDSIDEAQRRAVAAEVPIDPGFGPLVDAFRSAGAEVTVVSDGWGFYIEDFLAEWDLPVFTNTIDFASNTLVSPHRDPDCTLCGVCGTCKPRVIAKAAKRGRDTMFIGDGTSDRHAARVADTVFAKGALARWCTQEGISHAKFENLEEVNRLVFP
jgi:2-hydroxy-3-keto-5-methylthiopentenyl-1-phosphate phosphatase